MKLETSVLSQKFVDEVSPDLSGRKRVAHGVSRGHANPPSPPSPLPPARERGVPQTRDGVRAPCPRARALGYHLTPLPGLWHGYPKLQNFVSELLTQDTRKQKQENNTASFQFLISSFCFLLCLILVSTMTLKAGAPDPDPADALIDAGH